MIMSLSQNDFVSDLTNLIVNVKVNKSVADTATPLVASCLFDGVPYGDKAALITVDTLSVGDYSSVSSVLTKTPPTVDEQQLNTTDRKVIAVTLSRYLMAGAFADEYSLSEAFAVILSMLEKTKGIYLYKKVVAAYENYAGGQANDGTTIPMLATQTVTLNLIDVDNLTGEAEKQAARTANSNTIYEAMIGTLQAMCSPTRAFNELAFETLSTPDDIKLIINNKFMNSMITNTMATLLNSAKISDQAKWQATYVVPKEQFANSNTQENVIGWLGDRNKYQIRPRFEVGTGFNDPSTLDQTNWLHFWLISGFVNGLPLVKFVANFV